MTTIPYRLKALPEDVTFNVKVLERVQRDLASSIAEAQESCPHANVLHFSGSPSTAPRRICLRCRMEEIGTHWSYDANHWTARGHKIALMGNHKKRLVIKADSSHTIHSLRLPGGPHVANPTED